MTRAPSTLPSLPRTTSRITTPVTLADCAIGGYTGFTSLIFLGADMLPPMRIAPATSSGGNSGDAAPGGGGGGGGAPATANAPAGVAASCQPTFALSPGANENCTKNEIGPITGDSYCHWRSALIPARLNARRMASLLDPTGNADV